MYCAWDSQKMLIEFATLNVRAHFEYLGILMKILKHINKNFKGIVFEGVNWIHLAHKLYALLNMI
jgi:hypothetical protein